ncbi:juvenile hormone esterase-like [Lutzomyia longipalpis]|uniref:juvenile hormone esterase-like n=1 Tax=Lutzomyia longipalpis TaxID=7200 RepID=UPI0024834967|nr:juvenile hormone esterase-like [Lutzomyia longipalpis]
MRFLGIILIFCASFISKSFLCEDVGGNEPKVCTKVGCIRGKAEEGRLRPYEAFYGIPYAEPPLGELRFENPHPHPGWLGECWDATYPRAACLQRNVFLVSQEVVGSEDCLYLNVYRPVGKIQKEKLPVMVWIHGGGWMSFSGNPGQFGPEYLMDNGEVILVTVTYRLGMFGFLCSGDAAVKGNVGLKDQQMALKWVVSNIEEFGGNPHAITLAGQSVGAASVQLHMLNPISRDLFQRAIVMSGSAIASWAISYGNYEAKFRQGVKNTGLSNWNTSSTFELASQLKELPSLTFVSALDDFTIFREVPVTSIRPCIEGNWEGAFLTEDPRKVWAEGRFHAKPILTGVTSNEGAFTGTVTTNATLLEAYNENIYEFIPIQFDMDPRYMDDVFRFYLAGKDFIDQTNVKEYEKMFGDKMLVYPMFKFVQQYIGHADLEKNPIFLYKFAFESDYTFVKFQTGLNVYLGVSHIDDLFFLFTMKDFLEPFKPDTPEGRMTDIYVRTIVNFVARGKVETWRPFRACTPATFDPFCDRQIFKRYEKLEPNQVEVKTSNQFDLEMIKLWNKVDRISG